MLKSAVCGVVWMPRGASARLPHYAALREVPASTVRANRGKEIEEENKEREEQNTGIIQAFSETRVDHRVSSTRKPPSLPDTPPQVEKHGSTVVKGQEDKVGGGKTNEKKTKKRKEQDNKIRNQSEGTTKPKRTTAGDTTASGTSSKRIKKLLQGGGQDEVGRWIKDFDQEGAEPGMQFFQVLKEDGPAAARDPFLAHHNFDSDDERALEILPTDFVLVAACTERDWSSLEVYVYDGQQTGTFYVHHDIPLTIFPLCLAYLCSPSLCPARNLIAVGGLDPDIGLWDIDVVDELEPELVLSGHTDAIMTLHTHPAYSYQLASGSADGCVRIWDISSSSPSSSFVALELGAKVQAVRWSAAASSSMLAGGFCEDIVLADTRGKRTQMLCKVKSDVEAIRWNPFRSWEFVVSCEGGTVDYFDARTLSTSRKRTTKHLWSVQAHKKAATGIDFGHESGLLLTCSIDGKSCIWNTTRQLNSDGSPTLVLSKDIKAGPLYGCSTCADDRSLFALHGEFVALWDVTSDVGETFKQ